MRALPLQIGDVIAGKYRLIRMLGEGGMGSVFEAENTLTMKRVALKLVRATANESSGARDRLLREARAAARISHRNVVDIYDAGFDGDTLYLVMELLHGETLLQFLSRSEVSIPEFLVLLFPAMRGVAEAHRQGVLHRDLKPENLFLAREVDEREPVCKVLDFGISHLEGSQSLTRTGQAIGTPIFMSLEQLRGLRDVDARADVYGFAVILYIALTGQPPFHGESLPELVLSVATSDPAPLHEVRPELPMELSNVVMRALAREREQRTASVELLMAELLPFASEGSYRALAGTLANTLVTRFTSFTGEPAEVPIERRTRPSARPATSLPSRPASRDPAIDGPSSAPTPGPRLRGFVALSLATGLGAVLAIGGQALLVGRAPSVPATLHAPVGSSAPAKTSVPWQPSDAGVVDRVQASDALAAPLTHSDAGAALKERAGEVREPARRARTNERRRQDVARAPAISAAPLERPDGAEGGRPVEPKRTEPPAASRQKGALRVDDFVFAD